jgi:small subunit ribosomal protein S8e
MITQSRPKRKISGGRYKNCNAKKLYHKGNLPTLSKLGEVKNKTEIARGNNVKVKVISTNVANVYDSKQKKYIKAKIKTITECPANRHYVRRNIMTKGAIIDTDLGKAKITSRPGQSGVINAILMH